jgi:hypothetical protein
MRLGAGMLCAALAVAAPIHAQEPEQWDTGVKLRGAFPIPAEEAPPEQPPRNDVVLPANTTVVPRTGTEARVADTETSQVNLIALLTVDGQQIDQGLVWRIYEDKPGGANAAAKPLMTRSEPSPTVALKPGAYIINAAFGRADLTRNITVAAGTPLSEKFVLNAGGLRVNILIDGAQPAPNTVSYEVLSGERDQSDNRTNVIEHAKPNTIIRLNAGIYRIVSTYGDANAQVEADVTVEAGKLTEATVSHTAARVTFKLVTRAGGEALPDTQWIVQSPDGQTVKQSVGALPSHILAPGTYTIIAKSGDRTFKRDFTIANGEVAQVEVLMQ